MKKLTLILVFFSMFCQVKSQFVIDTLPWCPPGATWLYKSSSPSSSIYIQFIYVKDTFFYNLKVKKIVVEGIQIIGPSSSEFARTAEIIGTEYLYNSNDSIYWFDKISNDFKFIYSFNPKLNDEFVIGNSRAICYSNPIFPKTDTIRVTQIFKDTFDNFIFDVYNTDFKRNFKLGAIIKNIGSTSAPFPQINPQFCNNFKPEYGIFYESLICYSDSLRGTLTFSAQGKEECHFAKTFVKKVTKKQERLKSKLFPNPAQNSIKIENAENIKYHSLGIYNYLGQQIIMQNGYKEIIDISELNTGLYFVKLYHSNGFTETINFLKN